MKKAILKDYPNYTIYANGTVIHNKTNRVLSVDLTHKGYPRVFLYDINVKRKAWPLHRLLATCFIPNPTNLPIVRHLDDNKLNFSLENLAWGTASDNQRDAVRNGKYNVVAANKRMQDLKGFKVRIVCKKSANILGEFPSINELHKHLAGPARKTLAKYVGVDNPKWSFRIERT